MRNEELAVIETARDIAFTSMQLMQTDDPKSAARLQAKIDRSIERLKQIEQAPYELQQVLDKNPGSVTKMAAAYALYLIDPSQVDTAVEALVTEMNRPASSMIARMLLAAIGTPAVPALARQLNNSNIVNLLGAMGPAAEEAVPALVDVLGTKNVEVAASLVKIGTDPAIKAALPVLMDAAKDPYNHYATMAVTALGELGREKGGEAIPVVREALNSASPDTRIHAAVALAELEDTEYAINALSSLSEDSEISSRYLALNKLNAMGSQALSAKPALIRVLLNDADKQYGDRALAAAALITIDPDDPEITDALKQAAREPQMRRHMHLQQ